MLLGGHMMSTLEISEADSDSHIFLSSAFQTCPLSDLGYSGTDILLGKYQS